MLVCTILLFICTIVKQCSPFFIILIEIFKSTIYLYIQENQVKEIINYKL